MPDNKEIVKTTPEAGEQSPAPMGRRRKTLAYRMIKAVVDLVIFSMLASIMFTLKVVLAGIPNIEPVSLLIIVYTAVYRFRALIPIYIYVILEGLLFGFSVYWIGYLYVWAILWGVIMLIPRRAFDARGRRTAILGICLALISGAFGLAFGALFAPSQIAIYGLSFDAMLAWIAAGLPYDILHGCGNFAFAAAAIPLIRLIKKLESQRTFK